uniref:Gustatory receptor n=1 Tax=Anopheles funestus TaxID=62324 RepID=A0A182S4Y6_ANOFN
MCLRYRNPRHVYDVLRPLLAFSKVFGQTAFLIEGEPPYVQIKVTRVEYVALLINIVANSLCVYINVTTNRLSRLTGSTVMDMGLSFLFPLGATIMLLLAIDNFLRRNTTCTIMAELFSLDRSLQRKNYKPNHRRQYVVLMRLLLALIGFITTGTIFSLVMGLVSEFSAQNHMTNAFSYAYTGVQFMIVNFHFVAAARLLTYRLEAIKCCIKKHLESGTWWIEQKQRWGRRMEPIDVVAELAGDFASLGRIVERVNRIYSNQIVGLIMGVGMFSIFVIYVSSYTYYVGSTQESRLTAILLTAWMFYVLMVGLIFFSGMGVENTSNDIVDLLHEALHRENDLSTKRKLVCFSQQTLLRQPTLRCMFYDYNWKTLFSIFGLVVTYLIILLQFDKISEDPSNEKR